MTKQEISSDNEALKNYILQNSEIKSALGETIIATTKDRVENCLLKYLKKLEKSKSWITSLSLLIVTITTLLTTEFKDFIIPKNTWQAIYIIGAGIAFLWFFKNLFDCRKSMSVDKLLEEIQKSSLAKKIN